MDEALTRRQLPEVIHDISFRYFGFLDPTLATYHEHTGVPFEAWKSIAILLDAIEEYE